MPTPTTFSPSNWGVDCQEIVRLPASQVGKQSGTSHLCCHLSDPRLQRFANLVLRRSCSRDGIAQLGYREQACALQKTYTLLSLIISNLIR